MDKAKENKNQKKNHGLIIKIGLPILAVCFVVGIFQLVNSVPAVKEAITLATTKKPETFTELYFEDHLNLPKTIERRKEYSFVFTVHNVKYKDIEYQYEVYIQRDEQKITLDQGKFNLKDNAFKSVKEEFGPLKNIRSEIVVELTNKNQQIDFWMEKQ